MGGMNAGMCFLAVVSAITLAGVCWLGRKVDRQDREITALQKSLRVQAMANDRLSGRIEKLEPKRPMMQQLEWSKEIGGPRW